MRPEAAADLLERLRLGAGQPVAHDHDLTFSLREGGERTAERLAAEVELDRLFRKRLVARDEVAEDRVVAVADGSVEARRRTRGRPNFQNLLNGERRLVRDLLERRLTTELRPEEAVRAVDLLEPLDDVNRHADRPRLVGERPRHRLADPPRRVRRELEPAAPVELLDGADEPERPFLDQVEERQALVSVVLGDRDDEPQVRLDHALLRVHVAALDPLRKLDLLGRSQELMPAGFPEEELQRVGRGLDGCRDRRDDLGVGDRQLDDLDPAVVELAEQRILLELVQLVRLCDLREVGRADGPDLLGLLEQ